MTATGTKDTSRRALEWMFGDDTGVSSRTIAAVMLDVPHKATGLTGIPLDGGDLGRCIRLLDRIPEWRPRLEEVAAAQPQWRPLVEHWSELEALYAEEMRENAAAGNGPLQARHDRTYKRISELIDW